MNKLDLEETTRRFHYIYEQVAKEYGYKTREDTKELDFNSPNGMTMLKTVEMVTTPYLEEIERLGNEIQVQIEDNVRLNEYIEEKDKEIERLKEEKESWKRVATKNFNEAEDYKAIIKEVREYVYKWENIGRYNLLEMLDKVEE